MGGLGARDLGNDRQVPYAFFTGVGGWDVQKSAGCMQCLADGIGVEGERE